MQESNCNKVSKSQLRKLGEWSNNSNDYRQERRSITIFNESARVDLEDACIPHIPINNRKREEEEEEARRREILEQKIRMTGHKITQKLQKRINDNTYEWEFFKNPVPGQVHFKCWQLDEPSFAEMPFVTASNVSLYFTSFKRIPS